MKKAIFILLALVVALAFAFVATADSNTLVLKSSDLAGTVAVSANGTDYGSANSPVLTWKHGSWPLISGSTAEWISSAYYVEDPVNDSWRKFTRNFDLCASAFNISGSIQVNSDNAEVVYLNGGEVGIDGTVYGAHSNTYEWQTVKTYDIDSFLEPGTNTLEIVVRNYSQSGGTSTSNPTGLIYQADITYSCPIVVNIDIKPGSYPSCFNNDGNGVIPVAILGSETFDVTTVDPGTVTLDGLAVAFKGKSDKLLAAYEDVNGDGYLDLVLKIQDIDGTFTSGSGTATITGKLYDGTPIIGTGDICIVP